MVTFLQAVLGALIPKELWGVKENERTFHSRIPVHSAIHAHTVYMCVCMQYILYIMCSAIHAHTYLRTYVHTAGFIWDHSQKYSLHNFFLGGVAYWLRANHTQGCGLYRQVVLMKTCISITEVVHELAYSGLYRQVVLMKTCISITEVVHELAYSGLYRQVVLMKTCISITEVVHELAYSGLYRQVVLMKTCISITEVVHELAYSGLYRQVVFETVLYDVVYIEALKVLLISQL